MIGRRFLATLPLALVSTRGHAAGAIERTVRFAADDGARLEGTLLLPRRSELQYVPGVVLVQGSGPTDRDGNNPLVPQRIDLLRAIATLLAEVGIATLRYDKRGIGASARDLPAAGEDRAVFFAWDRFVGDVRAAHAELLRHDEIKRHATGLLGHSEGGLLALAAFDGITASRPHAVVLASMPGYPLGELVTRQLARGAPHLVADAGRALRAIAHSAQVPADLPAGLSAIFPPYAGRFWQGAATFDPATALRGLPAACLVLHGGADHQVVPMADIQPLLDAMPARSAAGEVLVAPGASHNLKPAGPDGLGLAGPLDPAIASRLAGWLVQALGA
ncbi:MAG: alpha/beta hydrolase [Alphaproteobacteria bacterium]|nr:alpha/beta hydrolase [Alphaproteobacteria bacterium]